MSHFFLKTFGVWVVMLVVVLTACASPGQAHEDVEGAGKPLVNESSILDGVGQSTAQIGDLEDFTVTYDEYVGAWKRFAACVEKIGYVVEKFNEVNQVIEYQTAIRDGDDGITDGCYKKEFAQVDVWWQGYRQAVVQVPVAIACLQEANIEPKDFGASVTVQDRFDGLVAQLEASGSTLDECLASEVSDD